MLMRVLDCRLGCSPHRIHELHRFLAEAGTCRSESDFFIVVGSDSPLVSASATLRWFNETGIRLIFISNHDPVPTARTRAFSGSGFIKPVCHAGLLFEPKSLGDSGIRFFSGFCSFSCGSAESMPKPGFPPR
jgi:hypothetical protein